MDDLLRSFVRALASVVHPRMLGLTLIPFIAAALFWGALLWFTWQPLVQSAHAILDGFTLTASLYRFLDAMGVPQLHEMVAPFAIIAVVIPLIVLTILLLIAILAMPMVLNYLSARRFATLEVKHGGTWFGSLCNAVWSTFICVVLLVITLPLWLVPPLFAVIPPVLWGWLAYRVMTYDALAYHASRAERYALIRQHRWPLFAIGVASGLLSAAPTLIWVASFWAFALFPLVAAIITWVYALVLVFSALWFGNYCLYALQASRAAERNLTHTI